MEIGFDIEKYLVHSKKVDYFRVACHPGEINPARLGRTDILGLADMSSVIRRAEQKLPIY